MTAEGLSLADDFATAIDHTVAAEQSVVRRYCNALRFLPDAAEDARFKTLLSETSLREGLRIVPLLSYRGIDVSVMDATSLTRTRTLKSLDGCVTIAHCRAAGYGAVVFESGGNTGTALTAYAVNAGIEAFLFVPAENLDLLDTSVFDHPRARVIAVDDPAQVKAAATSFARQRGIAKIPELTWRRQASTLLGCFVLEHFLVHGCPDFFVQGISAAFAPVGVYGVLERYRAQLPDLPAFLGIQQADNCPMARAWRAPAGEPERRVTSTSGLLARVMYDGQPSTYGTFDLLRGLLLRHRGDILTLNAEEFRASEALRIDGYSLLEHLERAGIAIGVRDGDIIDRTGLMGLAATLREIEAGRFPAGSKVLVFVTGGGASPNGGVVPSWRIGAAAAENQ